MKSTNKGKKVLAVFINCGDCGKKVRKVTNTIFCKECSTNRTKKYRKGYKQRSYVKRKDALNMRIWRKENPHKHRASVKRRSDRGREKVFNKHGKKCFRCGYNEFEECLDFHHIDKTTKKRDDWMNQDFNDWDNLMILCCNCHQAHHRVGVTLA